MAGWVKIHRQIQENAIWTSDEPFDSRSAWIDLILMANHEEKEVFQSGKFFMIKRGQLHRSQIKLAERWHWTKKRVNNFLKELKKVNMIDFKSSKGGTTQGTTITIVNYDLFQFSGVMEGTTVDTSEGPSMELRRGNGRPINKNIKNEKEVKKEREEPLLPEKEIYKHTCGIYQNVLLTNEEAAKLVKEFPSECEGMIDKLSEYIKTSGKKYANHYAVVCKWIREDRKKNPRKEDEEINARQREEWRRIDDKYGIG